MMQNDLELAQKLRDEGEALVHDAIARQSQAMRQAGAPNTHMIPVALGVLIAAADLMRRVSPGREAIIERMVLDTVRGILRGENEPVDEHGRLVTEPYVRPHYDA